MKPTTILLAEDEDIARENLAHALAREGYAVTAVKTGLLAAEALREDEFDLVITDMRMPDMDGMQLLAHVKESCPDTEVIIITGFASVESAVAAMRNGAYQYLAKPVRLDEVALVAARAIEQRRLRNEVEQLRQAVARGRAPLLIGQSQAMLALKRDIARIAGLDCTVLIHGETGTGKELVAKSLHAASSRAANRFLAVNCASFTEELFAHELFGHEKDAFTGARSSRKGLLEAADAGTFFLDEIGELPFSMQAGLLRVLETRTLLRVGGTREIPVDLRIIAATNRDLPLMVEEGGFRRDLYHRLNVISLRVPTLAERQEDIPLLAGYFASRSAAALGRSVEEVDDGVLDILRQYPFPGNVRELEHMMERAVALCGGKRILPAHLPADLREQGRLQRPGAPEPFVLNSVVDLEESERRYLAWVLRRARGSKGVAASMLGLNRGSLWRKLKRLGLE